MKKIILLMAITFTLPAISQGKPPIEIDVVKVYEAVLTNGYESDEVYRYLLWRYTNRAIPDTTRIRELDEAFLKFKVKKK